jgi:hypothetical protein
MAKAKKTKPRELIRWRVNLIKGTPAKFIDFVEAPDAKTAEDIAATEYKISDTPARSVGGHSRGLVGRPLGRARR